MDTCSQHKWPNTPDPHSTTTTIKCRGQTVSDSAAKSQSGGYPYVWKIKASLMWRLMRQQTVPRSGGHLGGYYYFGSNAFLYMRHPAW